MGKMFGFRNGIKDAGEGEVRGEGGERGSEGKGQGGKRNEEISKGRRRECRDERGKRKKGK